MSGGANRKFGFVLAILGAILFSTKAILIKLAYAYPVTPATLLMLRMVFAMPIYLFVINRAAEGTPRPTRRDMMEAAAFGVVGYYGASFFDFAGLAHISVNIERLLLYTYPLIVILLSAFALGRQISRKDVIALAMSYAGVMLVVVDDRPKLGMTSDWLVGVLLVLMSAVAYAIYLIGSQRIIPRLGASRYTALAMLAATGGVLLHFVVFESPARLLELPPTIYGYGLALGIFCTALPTFLTSAGVARIGAADTAIAGAVGPAATMLLAWLLLGESVTAAKIVGTILIVYGVNVASRSPSR